MYVLRKRDGTIFYLHRNKTYLIGRKEADIVVQDQSVSKKHAKLKVNSAGRVFVQDLKSSNKTFINNQSLIPENEVELKVGQEVKFGAHHSIYALQKCDDFVVTISGLSLTEKKRIEQIILQLPGQILNQWAPLCTHVVIERLILSIKVLDAFVHNQQIVTPQYFEELLLCIKDNKPFPNADAYRPTRKELQNTEIDFTSSRKNLFKNKIFVFSDETSKKTWINIIVGAAGKAIVADPAAITIKDLSRFSNLEYIFVINDQHSLVADSYFHKCVIYIKENGRRAIPIQEIALAVLHSSCEYNCNTLFDKETFLYQARQKNISSSEILTRETQVQLEENSNTLEGIAVRIIPPILESNVDLDSIIDVDEYVPSNDATFKRVINPRLQETIGKKTKLDNMDDISKFFRSSSGVSSLKKNTNNDNSTLLNFFENDKEFNPEVASFLPTNKIASSLSNVDRVIEDVVLNISGSKRLSDETLVSISSNRISNSLRNSFITNNGIVTTLMESQNPALS